MGPFLRFSFPSRLSQAGISSLSLGGKVQVDTSSLLYLHELQCYITCYHIPDMHLLPYLYLLRLFRALTTSDRREPLANTNQ